MAEKSKRVYMVETPVGLFLIDERMTFLRSFRFKNIENGRKWIKDLRSGKLDLEVTEVLRSYLSAGYELVCEDLELVHAMSRDLGKGVVFEAPSRGGKWARENPEAVASYFSGLESDMLEAAKKLALKEAEEAVERASVDREKALVEAVKSYDVITKAINELAEKFRDWSELICPGLLSSFKGLESALRFIAELGMVGTSDKEQIFILEPSELDRAKAILVRAEETSSTSVISAYAAALLNLMELREKTAKHIETLASEIAPNVTAVAGPSLAAKLITRAGGILELAKLPSSTIQVLGAERALFRALKFGSRPPKHGLIFQHPLVHSSPRRFRGKIARALAAKISLAVRIDAFRGEDVSEKLKRDLKVKVDEIRRVERR